MGKLKKFFVLRILKKLARFKPFKTLRFSAAGVSMVLDLSQKLDCDYALGKYDNEEMEFLKERLGGVDYFLDIGSNIGFYSLFVRLNFPNIRVIAFEPDSYSAARLNQNASLNCIYDITVDSCAVADFVGQTEFNIYSHGRGINSLLERDVKEIKEVITASCITLKEALSHYGISSDSWAMKMDIEGYEYPALRKFFDDADASVHPRYAIVECLKQSFGKFEGSPIELFIQNGYRLVGYTKRDNFMFEKKS